MAVTLDGLAVELPKEWASATLRKGFQESVVGKLSSSEPMPTNGKVIPIYEGGFEVGHVAEGGRKPASDAEFSFKGIKPEKFAGLLAVSKEAARANPAQMVQIIQQDMINAVARQLDFGIFYGKSANNGQAIPGSIPHVNQTASRVELDETKDLIPQFLAGYDLASAGESDPDGFAFDSRYRTRVLLASQQQLAPAGGSSPMPNLAAATATFGGLTAAFGRTVAGRVGANAATAVKGFVGDWSKLRWGFSENLQLDRSDQASWVDSEGKTWHAFQDNMILYRVEFEAGWYLDPADFAAYDVTPPVTP